MGRNITTKHVNQNYKCSWYDLNNINLYEREKNLNVLIHN